MNDKELMGLLSEEPGKAKECPYRHEFVLTREGYGYCTVKYPGGALYSPWHIVQGEHENEWNWVGINFNGADARSPWDFKSKKECLKAIERNIEFKRKGYARE